MFGTNVSDLQSGVSVSGTGITGTLKYYDDSTKALVQDWGAGNFLVLKFTASDWSIYDSVKVGLSPSAGSGLVEIKNDPDKNGVFKISQQYTQDFVVQTTIDGVTSSRMYALDELVCEGK